MLTRRVLALARGARGCSVQAGAASAVLPTPAADEVPDSGPLVDSFGRVHDYLRISLTEKCNLRCTYCMPAEGAPLSPRAALLTPAETLALAAEFAALGVNKIRLTGGEPSLRRDLPALVGGLAALAGVRRVGLTSNGVALAPALPPLAAAGLAALNLSLDTLRPERYQLLTRRPKSLLKRVWETVELALRLDIQPLKINCVLMKGINEDELEDFVELTRDRPLHVRFIEFMPFSGNAWSRDRLVPYRAALRRLAARYDLLPEPAPPSDTARVWRAAGHAGTVGFIASMSAPFCGGCNRLRLTADGVPVRRGGGVAAGRAARRPARGAARAPGTSREETRACGYAGLVGRAQPAHGADRRLGGARALSTAPPGAPGDAGGDAGGGAGDGARLTHVDGRGALMVDVGHKAATARRAVAACELRLSAAGRAALAADRGRKGSAAAVAETAGVLGAKRTADLLPLCHPLALTAARATLRPSARGVRVTCDVRCAGPTGAEMEALTGAAVAALALYDMLKAADPRAALAELRLVHKSGGKADYTEPGFQLDD